MSYDMHLPLWTPNHILGLFSRFWKCGVPDGLMYFLCSVSDELLFKGCEGTEEKNSNLRWKLFVFSILISLSILDKRIGVLLDFAILMNWISGLKELELQKKIIILIHNKLNIYKSVHSVC